MVSLCQREKVKASDDVAGFTLTIYPWYPLLIPEMAYPEPVAPLDEEEANDLQEKMEDFEVAEAQRDRIRDLRKEIREGSSS